MRAKTRPPIFILTGSGVSRKPGLNLHERAGARNIVHMPVHMGGHGPASGIVPASAAGILERGW